MRSKKAGAVVEGIYRSTVTSGYPSVPGTTVEKGTHQPSGDSSRRHQCAPVDGS
jgi:hypothetical protein